MGRGRDLPRVALKRSRGGRTSLLLPSNHERCGCPGLGGGACGEAFPQVSRGLEAGMRPGTRRWGHGWDGAWRQGHGWEGTQGIRGPPDISLERQPTSCPRPRSCVARGNCICGRSAPHGLSISMATRFPFTSYPHQGPLPLSMSRDSGAPMPPASELFYSQLLTRAHTRPWWATCHYHSPEKEKGGPGEGSHCLSQGQGNS